MTSTANLIPIVKMPDPVLRQIAQPVAEITDGVRQLPLIQNFHLNPIVSS